MTLFKKHLNQITYVFITLSIVFPVISIAISQIFLSLAILGFILDRLLNEQQSVFFPPIKLPLSFFILTTVLSWLLSPDLTLGLPPINKLWLFVIILLVANYFSEKRTILAYQTLFTAGIVACGFAFVQYIFPSLGSVQGRITGFMGHWMTLSGGLMLVFITLVGYTLNASPKRKTFWVLACFFLGITLVLTLTRSVWIASLAGLLTALWLKFPLRKIVILLCGGVILLVFFAPESVQKRLESIWDLNDPSNYARVAIWKTGLKMVKDNPWFGVGPQQVSEVFFDYHPFPQDRERSGFFFMHMHNNFLQFAAERGIPCALAWLWLMLKIGIDHYRAFKNLLTPSLLKSAHAIGLLNVVVLFLAGFFEFNFGDSEVLMIFLFLVIVPYGIRCNKQLVSKKI